jgi:UDP-N-acetylglucosamine 3-dehydrogenase
MGSSPVAVAVVGAGNMGRHHARNYADLPGADLRAIVDAEPRRAQELAARYGAATFSTVPELLDRAPEVTAVSVAVPTSLHEDVAGALLDAHRHVLIEKPIAGTVEEAERLIELAAERSVVLAVGHVERFNPAVRELKRRIDEGSLGDVLSLVARRVGVMPPQVRDANVIVDLAVHDIDVFRYLLGAAAPEELYCNAGKAIAGDRLDFADIFLRFDAVACFLQVNWVTPVKIRSLALTGSEGYAELEYVTQRLDYYPARPVREVQSFAELEAYSEQEPERLDFKHREPLAIELSEFLRAVRGEPGDVVTGEDGKLSMEIAITATQLAERRAAAPAG